MLCLNEDAHTDPSDSNALALLPDRLPRNHLVGPKVATMEKRIAELDVVTGKLVSRSLTPS